MTNTGSANIFFWLDKKGAEGTTSWPLGFFFLSPDFIRNMLPVHKENSWPPPSSWTNKSISYTIITVVRERQETDILIWLRCKLLWRGPETLSITHTHECWFMTWEHALILDLLHRFRSMSMVDNMCFLDCRTSTGNTDDSSSSLDTHRVLFTRNTRMSFYSNEELFRYL